MAQFLLLNAVKTATASLKPGDVIDDHNVDILQVQTSGGMLVAAGDPVLDAVADALQKRGSPPELAGPVMLAAYIAMVERNIVAHNTVDSHTTGVAVDSHTTGAAVAGMYVECLGSWGKSLLAPGVTVHAQDAGGGALNLIAGFTNHLPRRTLAITRSAAGPANVTYTCYYTGPGGTSATTQVVVPSGGTGTTLVAGEWTRVTTTVDPVSTSNFVTGAGFSVGIVIQAGTTPILSCNGVIDAIASSDLTTGTITPSTAPDAAKEFCVWTSSNHQHALTDAGHVHTITDAGHIHTLS